MKVLGLLFKWIVVPTAFAAVGYALIGPNIGRTPTPAVKKFQDTITGGDSAPIERVVPAVAADTSDRKKDVLDPIVTAEVTHVNGRPVKERKGGKAEEEKVPPVTDENMPPEDRGRPDEAGNDPGMAGNSGETQTPSEPEPKLPDNPEGN